WIVMKCLEKDAEQRYATAAALADDIDRHLRDEPVIARPPSRLYRIGKFTRRNRAVVAISSLLALALAAGTVVSTIAFLRADRARARAELAETSATSVTGYLRTMLNAVSPGELGRDATLREMLDGQDARLSTEFSDQPLIEATLRLTIGDTYGALGLFDEGEAYLRRAVALRTERLGPAHEDTIEAEQRLAANLRAQSRYSEAEPLLRETIAIQQRTLGAGARATLAARYELAVLLRVMGKHTEAESVARELLDDCRRHLGDSHRLTLESQQNLGALLASTGRGDEARSLMEDTIRLQAETLGDDHPDTLLSRFDLAIRYCGDGNHAEALAMYPDLLAAHERTLGHQHRMTLAVRSYEAQELGHVGRLAEAEALINDTLSAQRERFGDQHRDVLESMGFAAEIKDALGQRDEALALRRELLSAETATRGPDARPTLVAMSNYAAALFRAGDVEQSEALQRQALDGMREKLGRANDKTLNTTLHLVNLLQSTRQYDKESELLAEALRDFRATRPETDAGVQELTHRHAHMLDAMGEKAQALEEFRTTYEAQLHTIKDPATIRHYAGCYANALIAHQRFEEAVSVYADWIRWARSQSDEASVELAQLYDRQAYCLLETGASKDAEEHARKAGAIRRTLAPNDERDLAGSDMLLAISLQRQRRFSEAEPLLRSVLDIRKRVFGADHWLVHNTESVLGECLLDLGRVDETSALLRSSFEALSTDKTTPPPRVQEAAERMRRLATILNESNSPTN
ncbi:MAG: tetratricopeptide repeat protein, partial [Phycisphaerales bacterium]|nr:tetratricopeptide repeat protein [Phycisphaerales bacterium]